MQGEKNRGRIKKQSQASWLKNPNRASPKGHTRRLVTPHEPRKSNARRAMTGVPRLFLIVMTDLRRAG
jgi:hypothetical protein